MSKMTVSIPDLEAARVVVKKLAEDTLRSQGGFLSDAEARIAGVGVDITFDYLEKMAKGDVSPPGS